MQLFAYSLPEDLCSASAIYLSLEASRRSSLFTEVSSRISRCRCRALFARASSRILSFPRCRCRALVGLVSALQSLAGSRGVACRCSLRVILITPRRVVTLVGRSAGLRMCGKVGVWREIIDCVEKYLHRLAIAPSFYTRILLWLITVRPRTDTVFTCQTTAQLKQIR
jgi:hypothetical protein